MGATEDKMNKIAKKADIEVQQRIKGTFMWAVAQMKSGKKVKHKNWQDGSYVRHERYNGFINSQNLSYEFDLQDFLSTDWELFENPEWPKKTYMGLGYSLEMSKDGDIYYGNGIQKMLLVNQKSDIPKIMGVLAESAKLLK